MRNRLYRSLSAGVVFAVLCSTPAAQEIDRAVFGESEPGRLLKEGKVARAIRIVGNPPDIDGWLNDEIWTLAEATGNFVQRDPDNGDPATETTRLQFAYDDRYLYVALTLLDSAPDAIAAGLSRRDQFPSSDRAGIGFDPQHDHLTAYVFEANPSGVQRDFSISNDDDNDFDYNAVWEVRTTMTEQGWTAEFRIPFSQMRFSASPEAGQVWGMNSHREIRRKAELGSWVAKPRGEQGEVSLFGHLVFDGPITPPRRVELLPYALAHVERLSTAADSTFGSAGGLDARIGLGSATTLGVTVNPDFAQVEQDPAVLNLSVFETFFPEKRPFFLEDSRTFVPPFGLFQLFHSRRIGRTPRLLALPDGEEAVERPDETTILGAVKVTGKTSGWTYGGLSAFTGREYAIVDARARRVDRLVEPATSYNVVRVQRDILGASSTVGALATGVTREQAADAYAGGIDYNLRWDDNRTAWNGHWVLTRAPGEDGSRTGGGGVTNVNFSRKHFFAFAHADHFGRDFRVGDLGFFRARTDRNQVEGGAGAEQPDPGRWLRRYGGNVYIGRGWNGDGLVFQRYMGGNLNARFLNFWDVSGGLTRGLESLDDIDTRGGPPIVSPGGISFYFNVNSDSRKSWRLYLGANGGRGEAGDRDTALTTSLSLQPTARLQVSTSIRYERGTDIAQWIENRDTREDGVIDHVYGTLRRNVVDVTLRGTYSFHRDLTLQAYLQPFVAVGDYENIRRLARPRSFEFEPIVVPDNPDFNTKSVRGNVVMRWEYLRGSTLFVVWNLSRTDDRRPGVFRPLRDLGDAFGAAADHAVMVKVSYWLNR